MGKIRYRVPARKKILGTDWFRVSALKKFWVPMVTGYRLEQKFGYRRVPGKFSLMPCQPN